jgi:hypothetical protein
MGEQTVSENQALPLEQVPGADGGRHSWRVVGACMGRASTTCSYLTLRPPEQSGVVPTLVPQWWELFLSGDQ